MRRVEGIVDKQRPPRALRYVFVSLMGPNARSEGGQTCKAVILASDGVVDLRNYEASVVPGREGESGAKVAGLGLVVCGLHVYPGST